MSSSRKNGNPTHDGEKWQLRLYTAGQTPKSLAAIKNLKKVCEEHFAGRYEIEIVDLLKNPRLAKDDQIVAIPTLTVHITRLRPEPACSARRRIASAAGSRRGGARAEQSAHCGESYG